MRWRVLRPYIAPPWPRHGSEIADMLSGWCISLHMSAILLKARRHFLAQCALLGYLFTTHTWDWNQELTHIQSFQFEGLGHQQDTSEVKTITCNGTDTYGCKVGFVFMWCTESERCTITIDSDCIWTSKVNNIRIGLNKRYKYYYIYSKARGRIELD